MPANTETWTDEQDIIHGVCCICGVEVSTHDDAGQVSLSHCGDCNRPTCGDHREESGACRCSDCQGRDANVPHFDDATLDARMTEYEDLWDTSDPESEMCLACGGPAQPLGPLGDRLHFRCRACGIEQSRPVVR